MKRASIITLQYVDNYGSVLQAYATQKIVEKFGYRAEILNYIRDNCRYEYLKKDAYLRYRSRNDIFSFFPIAKLLQYRWIIKYKRRALVFDAFRNKHLLLSEEYSSLEELKKNPPEADIYITGSDQVWNTEYNGGILEEYFLTYVPKDKRKIAIAASFGLDQIAKADINIIGSLISTYKGISVREESSLSILQAAGYPEGICILDPTLMLSKEEWISKLSLKFTKIRYVFVYQLNENSEMLRFASEIACDCNIQLIIITNSNVKLDCNYSILGNIAPDVFLEYLLNAEYIVTDSFHGAAFSFNFNKDVFIFFPKKYSTRLESLLALTKSSHRHVKGEKNWKDFEAINFIQVNELLDQKRLIAKNFIRDILS